MKTFRGTKLNDAPKKDEYRYRIWTPDRDGNPYKVKYAGTGKPSWFTLEQATKLVNRKKGEMVYEHSPGGERMWEMMVGN